MQESEANNTAAKRPKWMGAVPKSQVKSFEDARKQTIDVVLLTAVEKELDAVLRLLKPLGVEKFIWSVVSKGVTYYVGRFGEHNAAVAMSTMGSAGSGGSTRVTEKAIEAWNPKALIGLGIAFGRDVEKQNIGDILLSAQVADYALQAIRPNRTVEHRGAIPPCSTALLDRFRNARGWTFKNPDGNKCEVQSGQLLSGPVLSNNTEFVAQLLTEYPTAIGGEMEATGISESATELKTEWIVVKAICDWGDDDKNKKFHDLAAASAASLVHYVLKQSNALDDVHRPQLANPPTPLR